MRTKRFGASCSSMPALCSRKTKAAAEPSRIGTSSAVMSTTRLSRPRPAQAESRCSTVLTFGPPGSPPGDSVVASRVSLTAVGSTLTATGCGRSTRRNTMPWSGGAGRRINSTRCPPCTPTPTARVMALSVRCFSMTGIVPDPARRRATKRSITSIAPPPAPPSDRRGSGFAGPLAMPPRGGSAVRRSGVDQSACLRRNAGISISSMPLLANASTFAAAVRPLRQTLGVVSAL